MTLFFDRSVGVKLPSALDFLDVPADVTYHQKHFDTDAPDDEWLPIVGRNGWTVIGHDHNYHNNQSELDAILNYEVGVFYMWGAEATVWEKLVVFARAFDAIMSREQETPRPFLFRIQKNGRITQVRLGDA